MASALGSLIGQSIDRYEIEAQLGQGGFGVVYLARHKVLGTKVALKVLWPDHASDPKNIERFLREARAAASIGSDHIARLFDAGITDDHVFLAMEVLEGHDLDEELDERGALPVEESVKIALEVLEALARAHEVGIVHRDLKPANVYLAKNALGGITVKLLDFGISKVVGQKSLTAAGAIVGTPQYMAPEQIDGQKLDGRADLYAVGILLYQMLSATVPFEGTGYEVLIERMRGRVPRPLAEVAPHVPGPITMVVDCALRSAREIRWRTADEMRDALRAALAGEWPDLSAITAEDDALPPIPATIPPSRGLDLASSILAAHTVVSSTGDTDPGPPLRTERLPSERPPPLVPSERPHPHRTELLPSEPPPPMRRPLRTELLPSEPPAPSPHRPRLPEPLSSDVSRDPSPPPAGLGRPRSAASWVAPPVRPPRASPSPARTIGWIAIAALALIGALGCGVLGVLLHRLATRPAEVHAPSSALNAPPQIERAAIARAAIDQPAIDPPAIDHDRWSHRSSSSMSTCRASLIPRKWDDPRWASGSRSRTFAA